MPLNTLHGSHAMPLVALSFLIAICASYTALTLAGRVALAPGRARLAWLLCGSVAMGSGIWSMHFVAMLAYRLPIAIAYDVSLVTLSWLAAVGASGFALFVAGRAHVGTPRLLGAGACLGLAVVTMHYTGMAAVRVAADLTYEPSEPYSGAADSRPQAQRRADSRDAGGLALDLPRLHRPDLILLDLLLPDVPGEEVLRQLRQTPDCRDIPVVVVSADATRAQMERLLAAGVHAYIAEPLDIKPFMEVVDDVLSLTEAA